MSDETALKEIVNQTRLALNILSDRQQMILDFTSSKHERNDKLMTILEAYRLENEACIREMKMMKQKQEDMMRKTKVQKRDVHFASKVNQKYKMAEAFLIGNSFDSYRKKY
jgi:hypothetical protein